MADRFTCVVPDARSIGSAPKATRIYQVQITKYWQYPADHTSIWFGWKALLNLKERLYQGVRH